MELRPLATLNLALLFLFLIDKTQAIRCRCTKESETVQCIDTECEIEGGSCLMLDHPTMGIHYTCHSKAMPDDTCRTKTSKSGASVDICGCDKEDFCNEKRWPAGYKSTSSPLQEPENSEESTPANSAQGYGKFFSVVLIITAILIHPKNRI